MMPAFNDLILAIFDEMEMGQDKYGNFASSHECYAVLKEEVEEFWAEVKKRDQSPDLMTAELTQVAAIAIRYILQLRNLEPIQPPG